MPVAAALDARPGREGAPAGHESEAGNGERGRRDRRRRGNRGDRPDAGPRESGALTVDTFPVGTGAEAIPAEPNEKHAAAASFEQSLPAAAEPAVLQSRTPAEPASIEATFTAPATAESSAGGQAAPAVIADAWIPAEPVHASRPPAVAASAAVPDLPPVRLSLPPDSGLVLVETSHAPAAALDPEPEVPAGPRRVRRPRAQMIEEPLQIVETRKDQPTAG
jgi:hypothetical protein